MRFFNTDKIVVISSTMENNWKFKTLENLEKNIWQTLNTNEESHLIVTCNSLRKKQLIDFSIEDLRIMIGQNIGLKFLLPIAIEILNENILAEGDFYEGDLLSSVLSSDVEFWRANKKSYEIVSKLFERYESTLKGFDTTWEIKKQWFDLFKDFQLINQNV